jgi:hypothetical protein
MSFLFNDLLTPDGPFGGRDLGGGVTTPESNVTMVGGRTVAPPSGISSMGYIAISTPPTGTTSTLTGDFRFIQGDFNYADREVLASIEIRMPTPPSAGGAELSVLVSVLRDRYGNLPVLTPGKWYVYVSLTSSTPESSSAHGFSEVTLVSGEVAPYTITITGTTVTVAMLGTVTVVPVPSSWNVEEVAP